MAVTYGILYQGQLATTDTALYSPTSGATLIDQVTVCNTTGSAETLDLSLVDGGGSMAESNQLYDAFSVGANSTVVLSGLINHRMETADQIRALASANTSLTLTISGREGVT
mgnify:CR=1 FL=1